jgi:hypothetical protein
MHDFFLNSIRLATYFYLLCMCPIFSSMSILETLNEFVSHTNDVHHIVDAPNARLVSCCTKENDLIISHKRTHAKPAISRCHLLPVAGTVRHELPGTFPSQAT